MRMFSQQFRQRMKFATDALDQKTKPRGSLGGIEAIAAQISAVQNTLTPDVTMARAVIFAADHGVVVEGVSAYPQEVTRQMLLNFAAGGAAINALCDTHNVDLQVINTGVVGDAVDGVEHCKIANGTANFANKPAMSTAQMHTAIAIGRSAVEKAASQKFHLLAIGEMGIGNTSSAAAITSALCDASAELTVGRGTGLNDSGITRKKQIVKRALQLHDPENAEEVLCCVGGFEIAAMVGAMLAAPAHDLTLVVDGYIVTAAALVAVAMQSDVRNHLIFSHQAAEPGHTVALQHLDARPLLHLDLRLGEGSGAVLAIPLIRSAASILRDMATFEDAGVEREHS